jgi:hypothetical protein
VFFVSFLKAMWGEAATPANNFAYDHPDRKQEAGGVSARRGARTQGPIQTPMSTSASASHP